MLPAHLADNIRPLNSNRVKWTPEKKNLVSDSAACTARG